MLNVYIVKKDAKYKNIEVKQNESVYEKIKQIHNGDKDILIVSEDQVCFFDETFSQFKNRIPKQKDYDLDYDLFIVVKSLSEIKSQQQKIRDLEIENEQLKEAYKLSQNQNQKINDLQIENEELKKAYKLLQNQYEEWNKKFLYSKMLEQQGQFSIISSDGNTTIFDSQIFENKIQKKQMEQLLGVVTRLQKPIISQLSNLCDSIIQNDKDDNSQVTSLIDTCNFCNNIINENAIQLSCYHKYHEECLVTLFFGQVQKQSIALSCLCQQTIKTNILNAIKEQNSQILLRHKLLQNQLNKIIEKNQLEQCKSRGCYFYFKRSDLIKQQASFCPICLN